MLWELGDSCKGTGDIHDGNAVTLNGTLWRMI